MHRSFLPSLTSVVGVDLGSSRTRIWVAGEGVVIDQPSVLAINTQTQQVIAVGAEAAEMEGRVQAQIKVHYPVKNGQVYDAQLAQAMLQVWLQQVLGWRYLLSPVVMVSVPAGGIRASRQAVIELFYELGAREVYTIVQPLAAAIGAGVPIADASGTLICQLGAGVAAAALISLGSMVESQSLAQAGLYLDHQLQQRVAERYQLRISLHTAGQLKQQLPLIYKSDQELRVVGQRISDQSPQEVELSAAKLAAPVKTAVADYLTLIQNILTQVQPELASDVLDKGVLLAGGLAQLLGLDHFLLNELKMPVAVVDEPDQVVIAGIGLALEHLDEFKQSLTYDQEQS